MAYVRKTKDYWSIRQFTSLGWEEVSAADTYAEARQLLKEYRENQPEYPVRLRLCREPKEPQQ